MERVRGRGGRGTHELAGLVARAEVVRLALLVREVVLGAPDARLEDACERSHEARVNVRSDSRSHDDEVMKESDAPSSSLNLMMTASLGGRFLLRTCWTSNANLQPRVHAHETWKCLGQSSHLMVAPTPLTWQRAHFCRQEGATSQGMLKERRWRPRAREGTHVVAALERQVGERLDGLDGRRVPDLELAVPDGAQVVYVAARTTSSSVGAGREGERREGETRTHFWSSVGLRQSRAVRGDLSLKSLGGGGQRMQCGCRSSRVRVSSRSQRLHSHSSCGHSQSRSMP